MMLNTMLLFFYDVPIFGLYDVPLATMAPFTMSPYTMLTAPPCITLSLKIKIDWSVSILRQNLYFKLYINIFLLKLLTYSTTRILGTITWKFEYSKIVSKVRVQSTWCSTVESLVERRVWILVCVVCSATSYVFWGKNNLEVQNFVLCMTRYSAFLQRAKNSFQILVLCWTIQSRIPSIFVAKLERSSEESKHPLHKHPQRRQHAGNIIATSPIDKWKQGVRNCIKKLSHITSYVMQLINENTPRSWVRILSPLQYNLGY